MDEKTIIDNFYLILYYYRSNAARAKSFKTAKNVMEHNTENNLGFLVVPNTIWKDMGNTTHQI